MGHGGPCAVLPPSCCGVDPVTEAQFSSVRLGPELGGAAMIAGGKSWRVLAGAAPCDLAPAGIATRSHRRVYYGSAAKPFPAGAGATRAVAAWRPPSTTGLAAREIEPNALAV